MPKDKESLCIFRQRMIRMFPGVFRADEFCLFCLLCHKPVMGKKVFNVKQHLATAKHKLAADIRIKDEKQLISPTPFESDSDLTNNNNMQEPLQKNEFACEDETEEEADNCIASHSPALIESEVKVNPIISSLLSNNCDDDPDIGEKKLQPLLELEYLQLRNYKMKLEILALEKQLNIPPSKFTSNI